MIIWPIYQISDIHLESNMIKIAILCAGLLYFEPWAEALKKHPDIGYDVIDIMQSDWLGLCLAKDYQLYLVHPSGSTNLIRQTFEERIQILDQELGINLYPSLTEIRLHENKKYLAVWLAAKAIPHPRTTILMFQDDAQTFIENAEYPLVAKQNIGTSGKGVKILRNQTEAYGLMKQAFKKGVRPRIGPRLKFASIPHKLKNAFSKRGLIRKRFSYYKAIFNEPQKFLILQEYVPHEYEWRVVMIGGSFFAHKKLVSGKMASGSLEKDYSDPPLELLEYVRDLCRDNGLTSTSIDLFESTSGFLVNEIQTYFGQSDPFQMKVGGVPGRYRYLEGQWVFEPGDWASNQCYDLRLEHALSLLEGK